MRYWLLTTEYPPFSGGGISTYCWHTGQMLSSENINVTIFVPDQKIKSVTESLDNKVRIVRYPVGRQSENNFLGWEAAMSYTLSRVIKIFIEKEGNPDVLESQEYGGIAYYTYLLKYLETDLLQETTLLTTTHAPSFIYLKANEAPNYKFPEYWIGEMERATLRMSDLVISPSRYMLNEINSEFGFANIPQQVLINPYEMNAPVSAEFIEGEICFFGKLTPQKGCIEMLRYFEELWKDGKKLKLRIIGGEDHYFYPKMKDMGKYFREKYSNYIESGLLIMEGHTAPEHLQRALKSAQVVLVPSRTDNLPYTVIESMAMGKIVLSSKDGGQKEVIEDGVTGFLFNHAIPGDFQKRLHSILQLTPENHQKIGLAANNFIRENFNYKTVWSKKKDLIQECNSPQVSNQFPFIRTLENEQHLKGTENDPLLSVIIPFYNMGDYVEDCLSSLEATIYPHLDIIIIDDGSTDLKSTKKINEIEKMGRARVFYKRNTGLCDTRNYGAQKALGQYVAYLDPDDMVEKHYYQKAIQLLRQYDNVHFIGCWAQYFGNDNQVWVSFNPELPYLLVHNMINSSALIYKKEALLAAGQNDPQMIYGMEDYESVVNMMSKGYRGIVIPEIMWQYRIRSGSMAQSFNMYSQIYLYRLIAEKHKDLYNRYSPEIINILNANGPGYKIDNPTKNSLINNKLLMYIKKNRVLLKLAKALYSRMK